MEIFTGKGTCVKCHYGPYLTDNKFHALLVPENPDIENDPRMLASLRFVAKMSGIPDYRNLKEDLAGIFSPRTKRTGRRSEPIYSGKWQRPDLTCITAIQDHRGGHRIHRSGGGKGNKELKPLGLTSEEKRCLKVFLTRP